MRGFREGKDSAGAVEVRGAGWLRIIQRSQLLVNNNKARFSGRFKWSLVGLKPGGRYDGFSTVLLLFGGPPSLLSAERVQTNAQRTFPL